VKIPSFSEEELRGICDILGATNSGLTNKEIDQLLASTSIEDPHSKLPKSPYYYYPISKRDRLYNALLKRQQEDNCGNNVANFILSAMNPVRYTQNRGQFDHMLSKLNTVLSFSGLSLGEDGNLRAIKKASTLSEAEQRANRLKQKLIERDAHPDVIKFCKAELLQDNYFHAVLEATKSVADKIRSRTGIDGDGSALVDEAFGFSNRLPLLAFNSLSSKTERTEQSGLMNLMKGMFGSFRNVTAHAPKIYWEISEQDALDLMSLASYLHRRIDSCERTR